MRNKLLKKLRKEMNLKLSKIETDFRIAKKTPKLAAFKDNLGRITSVPCERVMLVNAAKLPYKRVKKELRKMMSGGKNERKQENE